MRASVFVAPSAERDLDEIVSYLLTENTGAAGKFVSRFETLIVRLADHPHLGPVSHYPERTGLRRLAMPPHVIFYRLTAARVDIVRVLHAARDLDSDEFVTE